jgi:hypothetical protein
MIIDNVDRTIRWVELTSTGVPFSAVMHSGPSHRRDDSSRTEDDYFDEIEAASAAKGQTIVRLCNHEDNCRNPNPSEIEVADGKLKARSDHPDALDGVEIWNVRTMARRFVLARDLRSADERAKVMVRLERHEWNEELLERGLEVYEDEDGVSHVRPQE